MTNRKLTQTYVRERLTYNKDGSFVWNPKDPEASKRPSRVKSWNTRYAGTRADNPSLRGYYDVCIDNKAYKAHRIAWLYVYGELPDGQIDHIDGDKLNNRIENLRVVSDEANRMNMPKRSDNTSGVTGVTYHAAAGKWMAQYRKGGKNHYLGLFDTVKEAAKARAIASKAAGFHANHGRDPLKKNQKIQRGCYA